MTVTAYLIYSDFGVCPTAHRPFHASFCSLVLLFPVLWPALYLVLRPAPMITTWPLPTAGAFSFSPLFYVLLLAHWSDSVGESKHARRRDLARAFVLMRGVHA